MKSKKQNGRNVKSRLVDENLESE